MKKLLPLTALSVFVTVSGAFALTVPAEVVGVKVWVMEYQLKMANSSPMANAQVDAELDLTEGVAGTLSTPLVFEEVDVEANELSITFDNSYIHLKAYALDEGTGTYHYTSAAGIKTTSASPTLAADFDFMNLGEILSGDDDGRIVPQSYFPAPVLIEANSSHVIRGLVNLEYAVFFWNGVGTPSGAASWTQGFTANTPGFVVVDLDTVLALDTSLDSEVYLFAESSSDLASGDIDLYKAFAVFFDQDGNLHDGAGKTGTGYAVSSSAARLGSWKRFEATALSPDGTIQFKIARNYDSAQSAYYYEYPTSGFARVANAEIGVSKTFSATVDDSSITIHYKRVK